MTSQAEIKKDLEKINTKINIKKTAFACLDPKDNMVHTSQKPGQDEVMTREEWEAKMKAKGYTNLLLVTWSW